jgi:hypothetical protein
MAQTLTRDARELLTPDAFDGVVNTVLGNNPGMAPDLADRIVVEALKFVGTAAVFAPSRVVDEGWHALILHTALYAGLCEQLGSGFLHHLPQRPDLEHRDPGTLGRTVVLMAQAGYEADEQLWTRTPGEGIDVAAQCEHSGKCEVKCMNPPT